MASRTPVPAGQLGEREWDGLHAALNWLKKTSVDVSPSQNYDLSIDSVNSEARKHLAAVETFENAFAASGLQLHPEARDRIGFFHIFVKYWRDAAANAAALGLGGDISCAYYGHHIELPEEVMVARKWFETAVRLTTADLINRNRVEKFVLAGANHVHAIDECRSSWPRARRLSMERVYLQSNLYVAQWVHMLAIMDSEMAYRNGSDAASIETLDQRAEVTSGQVTEARDLFRQGKKNIRAIRACMLKKRTCAHCGTTGPLSQISFAYCGGCRDSGVARKHWMRYCSEACQRAHWHAGHKDECPCARDE